MNDNQAMLERSMRSVFVGNIPFDLTEERLKEVFAEVGPVLSFKLVYDRENGKPKGYGFCEYKDIETANSAMRNLNGFEIGGRVLKVDNAANEKTRMELQNSMSEPIVESAFEHMDPNRVPEAISKAVASLPPEQMFELMKQMKQCIQNNPGEARTMLLQNPQLAYGLLQSLVVMKIVDPEIALTMLSKPNNVPDLMNPEPRPVQPPPIRPEFLPPQHQQPQMMGGPIMGMGNNDLERPMDPRARLMGMGGQAPMGLGGQTPMGMGGQPPLGMGGQPPMGIGTGDVDLRTQMPMPVPAPVMPPLPHNPPMPDQMMRDPRQPPLPVAPPRDPRNMDPRSMQGMNPSVPPPLPRQPPPSKPPMAQSMASMAGMAMAGMVGEAVSDQEKTALIMQVLQLTNDQIAMLPADQRQSILMLKEQIAKSSQR